ncbi:MAG: hypothetical protein R3Y26_03325 [Rikenellaceae bacterium]
MNLKSLSQAILYFLILIIVLWGKDFFLDIEPYNFLPSAEYSFSGYTYISNFIFTKIREMGLQGYIIIMLATTINAFYLSRIIMRFNTNTPKSYLSVIVFLCLISIFTATKFNIVNQIIILFILSSCEKQIFIQLNYNTIKYAFLSAFHIGAAAIFAPIYYIFFIVLIITHLIASTLSIREISASLLGILTPLFFFSYFQWLIDEEFLMLTNSILNFYKESFTRISFYLQDYSIFDYLYALLLLFCSIVGILTFKKYNNENSTKFEYTYYLFLINMIVGLLLLFIYFSAAISLYPVITIGLASIISMFIVQTNRIYFKLSLVVIFFIFSICLISINT